MTAVSVGKVRVTAGKESEGRFARGSKWGMRRIEGIWPFPSVGPDSVRMASCGTALGLVVLRTLRAGPAVSARFLVMTAVVGIDGGDSTVVVTAGAGQELGGSEEVDCWRMGAVGSQPLAAAGLGVLRACVLAVCS
jgi:hypothetical protein